MEALYVIRTWCQSAPRSQEHPTHEEVPTGFPNTQLVIVPEA